MIRKMLPSEREAVATLFAAAREAAHWSSNDLVQLEACGAQIWVDVEEGRLTGAVASREVAGETEILNLAVSSEWRRRGIGRQLMQTALEEAASSRVGRVFLEVRESNTGAREFYYRLGFSLDGRRRNYYRNPAEDALLLSRSL